MGGDDQQRRALGATLGEALGSGDLATVLDAARKAHQRDPGGDEAARVVEALELMMSQVWLEPSASDDPFAAAGALLETCKLDEALAAYEAELARDPASERAAQLVDRVRLVVVAATGADLPEPDALLSVEIDVSTYALHLDAGPDSPTLGFDDVTAPVKAHIPPEAYREEPTMELQIGDYEVSGERVDPSKETTRVAGPGELPLEQLRAEMEAEQRSDAALDGLLDELEDEEDAPVTEVSNVEPIPVRGEPSAPRWAPSAEIPAVDPLASDPTRRPLEISDAAVPLAGHWTEPGKGQPARSGVIVDSVAESWVGLPIDDHDTSFEPGIESISADHWDVGEPEPAPGSKEEAEAFVLRGDLGEALRIYQELAASTPGNQRLWQRVAEIAKMLQRDSNPES